MKRYFNARNLITALKAFGVMLLIIVLILFVGSSGLEDTTFGLVMFIAFVAVFWICAFVDGLVRGQDEAKLADRLANQAEKTGKPLDEKEQRAVFSAKKGLAVAVMLATPGIVLAILSLLTLDANIALRVVTRFYFMPYLRLLTELIPPLTNCLYYFVFSVCYPAVYYCGYLYGPVAHEKIIKQLRKNEEDYKKGIRRKRPPSKKRRGFFSR